MGLVAAALIGAMSLTACGDDSDDGGGGGGTAGPSSDMKVGLAYDIGGRGDKSFNDSAAVGLDKAKTDLGIKPDNVRELSARANETDADRATRLDLLAKGGFNPIIAVGFAYAKALGQVAPKYPDVKFGIVDATTFDVKGANITNLVFAEEQGSYLVGAAAALKSTTGSVGFIGGCSVPLIAKFEAGFKAGAEKAKPGTKVTSKYLSTPQQGCTGFNDPAAGTEAAKGMYDSGVDVIFAAAGGSGTGVFQAAKAANKLAIGVDSDQYQSADAAVRDVIITSMIKRVDVAVARLPHRRPGGRPQGRRGALRPGRRRRGLLDVGREDRRHQGPAGRAEEADHRRHDQGADDRHLTSSRRIGTGPGVRAVASPRVRPSKGASVSSAATAGQPAAPARAPAVELRGITKRFPGVVANSDVEIVVQAGTVHAIVGENGAGKSTLMKILYGMQRPDEGTIAVDGRPVTFHSPAEAIAAGIGMVHQHFMLADNLTVLENVVLGAEPGTFGRLDTRAAQRRIREISDAYGLGVQPDRLVEELGVGDRQRIEILKVLYRGARILILDEPTAVLVPQEVDELFANLRELKSEGITVLFISHKLDEVLAVADEITVIRRGTTVATVDPGEVTARRLAELMVGGELPSPETRESTVRDQVVLAVEGLTVRSPDGRAVLDDVSLSIRSGEVLGIAGVEGNGQAELVEAIMGLRPASAGRVVLADADLTELDTREAAGGRHRLHPGGPASAGAAARGVALGKPGPRPPDPPAERVGSVDQPGGCARGHRADRPRLRRPYAGHRRPRVRAVRWQPAEADRGPGDERRSGAAARRPPHPRSGRRRAGGHLGRAADRTGRRAGRAAHLGRPRRADRPVRHDPGHPPRPTGRRCGPAVGHPRGAGLGNDRRRTEHTDQTEAD